MAQITALRILALYLSLSVFFADFAAARRADPIEVPLALKTELNQVLAATNDLHDACVKEDESKIDASLKNLISHIGQAEKKSALAEGEKPHLIKILEAARNDLEVAQMQQSEERALSLQSAFKQLVQVAQVFKLDPYNVFFCPKDSSVWLQKGAKPKNPVNPKRFADCGKMVR